MRVDRHEGRIQDVLVGEQDSIEDVLVGQEGGIEGVLVGEEVGIEGALVGEEVGAQEVIVGEEVGFEESVIAMSDDAERKSRFIDELPLDRVGNELKHVAAAGGQKLASSLAERLTSATQSLNDVADSGSIVKKAAAEGVAEKAEGGSGVKGAFKGAASGLKDKIGLGSSGGDGGSSVKATNIVESIDVGVPVDVAYNQWTQYDEWSDFMKKVERADADLEDTTVEFKAQVFWSHRTWTATIEEQVPNERIVWRSSGDKGHVDGAVTFHNLTPDLTRILVVLEYYPQGLFEHTGNLWRAPGRRARLELKNFRRHVMVNTILDPDAPEGWRAEIHEGSVVRSHDDVVAEEEGEEIEEDEGEEQ